MYRGAAGINELNALLQGILNPPKPKGREMKYGDVVYRTGDKVLQLVNQPEHNVFNGDMGEIVSIFYAKENTEKEDMAVVSFDGNEITFAKKKISTSLRTPIAVRSTNRKAANFRSSSFRSSKAITGC